MAQKDVISNTMKILKNGTPKEKINYLWCYYKWHFIILLFFIGAIANIIYTNVTRKEYVLQGIFLNTLADQEVTKKLEYDFLSKYPINLESQDIFLDTSLYYSFDTNTSNVANSYEIIQTITARIVAREVDFIVTDVKTLNHFSYEGYYLELSEILTNEQYKKYQPYFLYYDRAYSDTLNNLDIDDTTLINYPDPTKPELMEAPIPLMIDISESSVLSDVFPNDENIYAFAFLANGPHKEKSLEMLEFLMN